MFEEFLVHFKVTHEEPQDASIQFEDPDFQAVISELGGKTFNDGLYRVFRAEEVEARTQDVIEMFPKAAGRVIPFGCSWMGYYYALDLQQNCDGHHGCLLLLFSHNKALVASMSVADLHHEMVVNTDGTLEYELYRQWREKDQEPIAPNECVGFKVPLCLSGKFSVDNLERSDLSVYIGQTPQIWEAVRNLPEGASVDQIRIE